jgi:hypothetical protein
MVLKVYIAYRYSADNVIDVLQNIGTAIMVGHEVARIEGCYPFIPHLDCLLAMQSPKLSLEYYYKSSMEFLKVCEVMYLVDGKDLDTSIGVKKEYDYCMMVGKPVLTSIRQIKAYMGLMNNV